jgi:hypothetical protein
MIDALLVVWIATMGITRIDLLGGSLGFLLNPFLVLSPVVLVVGSAGILYRGGSIIFPRGLDRFFLLTGVLLSVVVMSTFMSLDPEASARRTVLLFVQVTAVLLGSVILVNQRDPRRVVVLGAAGALVICFAFNVLQVAEWFAGNLLSEPVAAFISLEPSSYAGVIPRLTGASHDPNLGGLLILTSLFLVVTLGSSSRWRTFFLWAGSVSLILTLSRSVYLASLVLLVLVWLRRSRWRISQRFVLTGAGIVAAGAMLLLLFPSLIVPVEAAWEILGGRVSLAEGSSQEHAAVFARGFEVATQDPKQLLLGIGYGSGYMVLLDIFPDNAYGNFHSLFITFLAESGIVAAALGVALFLFPLLRGGILLPMVAALLVYNIFQQSQTDPMTWFVLLLAWTDASPLESEHPEPSVPRGAVPEPETGVVHAWEGE